MTVARTNHELKNSEFSQRNQCTTSASQCSQLLTTCYTLFKCSMKESSIVVLRSHSLTLHASITCLQTREYMQINFTVKNFINYSTTLCTHHHYHCVKDHTVFLLQDHSMIQSFELCDVVVIIIIIIIMKLPRCKRQQTT